MIGGLHYHSEKFLGFSVQLVGFIGGFHGNHVFSGEIQYFTFSDIDGDLFGQL